MPGELQAAVRLAWDEARAADREPCGYLLGQVVGDAAHVEEVEVGVNVHPSPERAFLLAPEEHLTVRRRARTMDLRVLGFWHGHLVGDACPSREDATGLGPLGAGLVLIAGQDANDPPRLRAWRRVEGDAAETAWDELEIAEPG